MNLPDEILILILVKLSPKCVFKARCITKRFNNLIKTPWFLRNYAERREGPCTGRLLGFIQRVADFTSTIPRPILEPPVIYLPLLGEQISIISRELPGTFISSSHGLVLCGYFPNTYFIVNPSTKKSVPLPLPCDEYKSVSTGFFCEEKIDQLVANYKVVRTGVALIPELDNKLMIETYSSKTGKWVKSTLFATDKFLEPESNPIVLNGIFHWIVAIDDPDVIEERELEYTIALYDPNDIGGKSHLQLIEMIPEPNFEFYSYDLSRSSDGLLYFVSISDHGMTIWMLPMGENGYRRPSTIPKKEWSLVHTMTLDSLYTDCAAVSRAQVHELVVNVISLRQCNSLEVLFSIGETLFLFNMERESMELIQYQGRPRRGQRSGTYPLYPFYESLDLSSYALA